MEKDRMNDSFILFYIKGTAYAIPSEQVRQIEMIETITSVPNTARFVEGIVNLRGQVVPVINLRSRFGMEKIDYDLSSRLIVIQIDSRIVGLAVDSAREFVKIDLSKMMQPPESLATAALDYLSGVVSLSGRLVLIIDLQKLLTYEENEPSSAFQIPAEELVQ
jgi:chemotaxis signal transduction protein